MLRKKCGLRLLCLTATAVFAAEALAMLLVEAWGAGLPLIIRIFLDATLLVFFVFPTLYCLVFKEMEEQIQCGRESELALKDLSRNLEQLVDERTLRIQQINEEMLGEVQGRARCDLELGKALKDARAGREHFQAIVNSIDDGLMVIDSRRCVRQVNSAAEMIFASSAYDLTGKPMTTVLAPWLREDEVDGLFSTNESEPSIGFLWQQADDGPQLVQLRRGATLQWDGDDAQIVMLQREVQAQARTEGHPVSQ
jgi:PAS domain S-box-containing protein